VAYWLRLTGSGFRAAFRAAEVERQEEGVLPPAWWSRHSFWPRQSAPARPLYEGQQRLGALRVSGVFHGRFSGGIGAWRFHDCLIAFQLQRGRWGMRERTAPDRRVVIALPLLPTFARMRRK